MAKKTEKKQAVDAPQLKMFAMRPEDLVIVGVDTDDGPEHPMWDPRSEYDIKEDTVGTIMEHGVLAHVIATKDADGNCIVVDGRQRVLAAREANRRLDALGQLLVRVPTVIKRGDEIRMMGASIIANAHRRADSPLVSARKAIRYLDRGVSEKECAKAFKVTIATLKKWMTLLEAPREMHEAIENNEISSSQVIEEIKARTLDTAYATSTEDKPKPTRQVNPRKQGGPIGPKKKQIQELLDAAKGELDDGFEQALRWVVGEIDAEQAGVAQYMPAKPAKVDPRQLSLLDEVKPASLEKSVEPVKKTVAVGTKKILSVMTGEWTYCGDIAAAAKIDRVDTRTLLEAMVAEGKVEAEGKARWRTYRLV